MTDNPSNLGNYVTADTTPAVYFSPVTPPSRSTGETARLDARAHEAVLSRLCHKYRGIERNVTARGGSISADQRLTRHTATPRYTPVVRTVNPLAPARPFRDQHQTAFSAARAWSIWSYA